MGDTATERGHKADLSTLARGGSLNFLASAAGAALAMGLVLVVTNGLGPDDGGAFFEAIALFNIAVAVAVLGSDTGLLRFTSVSLTLDGRSPLGRTLAVALAPVITLGTVMAALGYMFSPQLGERLGGASHAAVVTEMVAVLSPFVPIGALAVALLGASRGYGTMIPTIAAERLGRPAVQLALGGLAVGLGWQAGRVAGAWGVGVVFSAVVAGVHLRRLWRRLDSPGEPSPFKPLTAEFWRFTLPRALASIFRVGVLWLDVVLVGAMISPGAAAVYTVATRLLQAGFVAVDALGQAVEPMFSSALAAGDTGRAGGLYRVSTGWLVALTWPVFLAMWIYSPTVLGLFGPEFVTASSVVAILVGSALVGSAFGPVDVLLVMAGKSLWSFRNSAIAFGLNVVLNLTLIPMIGLQGAALAWAVSRVVANVLPLLQVRSLLGVHPFGSSWWAAALASSAAFGAVGVVARLALGDGLLPLMVYLSVAGAFYAFLVWRWRTRLDLAALAALFGGRLARRAA